MHATRVRRVATAVLSAAHTTASHAPGILTTVGSGVDGGVFARTRPLHFPKRDSTAAAPRPPRGPPSHAQRTDPVEATTTTAMHSSSPPSQKAWQSFLRQLRRLRQETRHALLLARRQDGTCASPVPTSMSSTVRGPRDSALPTNASEAVDKQLMDRLGVSDLPVLSQRTPTPSRSDLLRQTPHEDTASSAIPSPEASVSHELAPFVEVALHAGLRTHASAVLTVHHVLDSILDGSVLPSADTGNTWRTASQQQAAPRDRSRTLCEKWTRLTQQCPSIRHDVLFPEAVCVRLSTHQASWVARRLSARKNSLTHAAVISTPSSASRAAMLRHLAKDESKRTPADLTVSSSSSSYAVPEWWQEEPSAASDVAAARDSLATTDLLRFVSLSCDFVDKATPAHVPFLHAALQCYRYAPAPVAVEALVSHFMDAFEQNVADSAESHVANTDGTISADPEMVGCIVESAMWALPGNFELAYGLWIRYAHVSSRAQHGASRTPSSPHAEETEHDDAVRTDQASEKPTLAFMRLLPALTASIDHSAAHLSVLQRPFENAITESDVGYVSAHVEIVRTAFVSLLGALARVSLEDVARVNALTSFFRLVQLNTASAVTQHAEVEAACTCVLAAAQHAEPAMTLFNKLLAESTRATFAFRESLIGALLISGRSAVEDDVARLLSFQALKYPITEDIRDTLAVKLLLEKDALRVRRVALQSALTELIAKGKEEEEEAVQARAVRGEASEDTMEDAAMNESRAQRASQRAALDTALAECRSQLTSATTALYLLLADHADSRRASRSLPVGHPSTLSQAVVDRERRLFLFVLTLYHDFLARLDEACQATTAATAQGTDTSTSAVWTASNGETLYHALAPVVPSIDKEVATSLTEEIERYLCQHDASDRTKRTPRRRAMLSNATIELLQSFAVTLRTQVTELTGLRWPHTEAALEGALASVIAPSRRSQHPRDLAKAAPPSDAHAHRDMDSEAALNKSSLGSSSSSSSSVQLLVTRRPLVFADLVASWSSTSLLHFCRAVCEKIGRRDDNNNNTYQLRLRDAATLTRLCAHLQNCQACHETMPALAETTMTALATVRIFDARKELEWLCEEAIAKPAGGAADTDSTSSSSSSSSLSVVFLEDAMPDAFVEADTVQLPSPVPNLRCTLSSSASAVQALCMPQPRSAAARHEDARRGIEQRLSHLLTFWLDVWGVEHVAELPSRALTYAALPPTQKPSETMSVTWGFSTLSGDTNNAVSFFDHHVPRLVGRQADQLLRATQNIPRADASVSEDAVEDALENDNDDDDGGAREPDDWTRARFGEEASEIETEAGGARKSASRPGARRRVKRQATYTAPERFVNINLSL